LKLLVMIKKGETPLVVILSGSKFKGCPSLKVYQKAPRTKADKTP
jgi:hypothetical protein